MERSHFEFLREKARSTRLVLWAGLVTLALTSRAAGPFDIKQAAEFNLVVDTNITSLTTNASGFSSLLEGPVWIPTTDANGGYLLFSAMDNNRIKKLVPPATVTDYLVPSSNAVYNGSTLDNQERPIYCLSGSRGFQVAMLTNNGSTLVSTPLVTSCAGLKFYSPNDVVVKSDGTIWFTDPGFNSGVTLPSNGFQGGYYVYRFNPANGNATCEAVIKTLSKPNGLCFSPDEKKLYVADYYTTYIKAFNVTSSNTVTGGTNFAAIGNGYPDGIRCDADGRVYSSSGNGVWIFNTNGAQIGRIITPKTVNNLCFGGPDWRTLYMAAKPYILSIRLKVPGAVSRKNVTVSHSSADKVRVEWPWPSTGYQLETNSTLALEGWSQAQIVPSVADGTNSVQFNSTNNAIFFRLRKPGI